MTWPRTILHADMDAFYAAVEQLDDPSLRGKPVIIGSRSRRGVVSTASYEARRFGVRSAMPSVEADRRCPDGIWIAPRMARYVEVSECVREVFERYTPLVEPLSLDEAFLDVSGSISLFGDGPQIAEAIRSAVRGETGGLTVSVGVATSKYVAKVASDLDKPDGLVVCEPGREAEFLAPLPVGRLWGVGKVTRAKLEAFGLSTIGDVQKFGERGLERVVGERGAAHWFALASGRDLRPVEPSRREKTIGHERTFSDDLCDLEACNEVLLQLSAGVGKRLRAHEVLATTVQLKLRLSPFDTVTRRRRLPAASDSDLEIYRVARDLLDKAWPRDRGVRLLGVTGLGLVPSSAPRQGVLFGGEASPEPAVDQGHTSPVDPEVERALDRALDAIRGRYGDGALRRGGPAS